MRSKYNIHFPKAGTISAILYKLALEGILERQENIGCRKGYGYKLVENPAQKIYVKKNAHKMNALFGLEV